MNHTKIVATLGPTSAKESIIRKLIPAGAGVFRLNFSHSTLYEHARRIERCRKIARQHNRSIAIIADLQGPKMRTGALQTESIRLKRGQSLLLTTKRIIGDETCVSVDYSGLPSLVKRGMIILLNDGMIKVRVISKSKSRIRCRVLCGGELGEHKGVTVLRLKLKSVFTQKDRRDIIFALKKGVDYFALSFVTCAADVIRIKKFISAHNASVPIVAKIEKPEAVRDIRNILKEVDGVMVARGDLGIEGKLENIPIWQKKIIKEANKSGKIVITATQMLESMISSLTPTRAEVTDVANAIFDGTDAVMLSGETAIGKYPVQVIGTMRRIIRSAEKSNLLDYYLDRFDQQEHSTTFSIAHAAINAAREAHVKAIIVFTISGFTARLISKRRPAVPIVALTPHKSVYNQMNLLWGVYPILIRSGKDINVVIRNGEKEILKRGLLKKGDRTVVVFGVAQTAGGTDRMKIMTIGTYGV